MTHRRQINISEESYKQLDRYRLREAVDTGDRLTVWTESWKEFFQRQLRLNTFVGPGDTFQPDEIDVMEIGMLEE